MSTNHYEGVLSHVNKQKEVRHLFPVIKTDKDLNKYGKAADAAVVGSKLAAAQFAADKALSVALGKNPSIVYETYEEMVREVNAMTPDSLMRGWNIYIGTIDVPDLWIYSVEENYSKYTYVNDATLVEELETNVTVQLGYFKIAQLEGQKVDLTPVNEDIAELGNEINLLKGQIQSFENTKSDIVGSPLGHVLGMSTSNTWNTVVDKIESVPNVPEREECKAVWYDNSKVNVGMSKGAHMTEATSGYPEVYIPQNALVTELGLTPEKIVEGNTVLGVAGTDKGFAAGVNEGRGCVAAFVTNNYHTTMYHSYGPSGMNLTKVCGDFISWNGSTMTFLEDGTYQVTYRFVGKFEDGSGYITYVEQYNGVSKDVAGSGTVTYNAKAGDTLYYGVKVSNNDSEYIHNSGLVVIKLS